MSEKVCIVTGGFGFLGSHVATEAAARGYISAVIRPRESRPRIIEAFDMLKNKTEVRPPRKHGNIPM